MLADTGHESSTIIKENLTRGITTFSPTIADEVQCALQEYISVGDEGMYQYSFCSLYRSR